MRTNIDINDDLLSAAMAILGQTTKRATIEAALREVVQDDERKKALEALRGIGWQGDLDKMRRGE